MALIVAVFLFLASVCALGAKARSLILILTQGSVMGFQTIFFLDELKSGRADMEAFYHTFFALPFFAILGVVLILFAIGVPSFRKQSLSIFLWYAFFLSISMAETCIVMNLPHGS